MNLIFNATPVMTTSLTANALLNMLGSGLFIVKRFGAPFTENHFVLNDLVVNQRPSKLGQFIVFTPEDAEILQQPLEEGNSRLLLLDAQSGNLVMAFDLPEEEIQQLLVPMLGTGFPSMRSFTPAPQVMTNMVNQAQQWNNPSGLNHAPLQDKVDEFNGLMRRFNAPIGAKANTSLLGPQTLDALAEACLKHKWKAMVDSQGKIFIEGQVVGKCILTGNLHAAIQQSLLEARKDNALSLGVMDHRFFDTVCGIASYYLAMANSPSGTCSIDMVPPMNSEKTLLALVNREVEMNANGLQISYTVKN